MVKSMFARAGKAIGDYLAPRAAIGSSNDNQFMQDLLGAMPTPAGVAVTEKSALKISTAMACVRIMSSIPASIGLMVQVRDGDRWSEDVDHPLNAFLRKPIEGVGASTWLEQLGWKLHAQGDAIARITRKGSYEPRWAQILDRAEIEEVFRGTDGRLKYRLHYRNLRGAVVRETVDQEFIIHVAGPGFDGCRSPSPIMHFARETLGIALATQDYQGRVLNAGGRPSGALEIPQGVSDETVDAMKKHWQSQYVGLANAGKTAVLYGGATFKEISFTSQEAEILQTRAFEVADIARVWGVPLHMLQSTDSASKWGTGMIEEVVGFIRFVLAPHLTRGEEAMTTALVMPEDDGRVRIRYRLEELLRGTPDQQAKMLETLVSKAAIITPNEARKRIGEEPIKGGDELRTPTGAAAQKSSANDGENDE